MRPVWCNCIGRESFDSTRYGLSPSLAGKAVGVHLCLIGRAAELRTSSFRRCNPALVTARRERQANMHRQSVWGSVFRLDRPAHCLDIAARDR